MIISEMNITRHKKLKKCRTSLIGICNIPPSNFASKVILKMKAAPLRYERIKATIKPGY